MKKFSSEEITEANQVPITDYLITRGYPVAHHKSYYALMSSPLRVDKNPSFHIDKRKNTWKDLATGESGDMIKLIELLYKIDFIEAVKKLLGREKKITTASPVQRFSKPNDKTKPTNQAVFSLKSPKNSSLETETQSETIPGIHKIKPLGNNQALTDYAVKERKIALNLAKLYLEEVYYKLPNKPKQLFAVGWKNEKNGYELRNKYFKSSLGGKDISIIPGSAEQSTVRINVFEGFFDFLSYLMFYQIQEPLYDTMILNSIAHLDRSLNYIKNKNYQRINLFLDNDQAGREAVENLIIVFQNIIVVNYTYIYKEYKDLNEFWVET